MMVKDKSDLTKSEVKILDYLQEYMNSSIYMTVTEIANNCGVGEATVTRFCRKLGFRSFLEFKMTMVQEFQNKGITEEDIKEEAVLPEDSVELIARKLGDSISSTIFNNLKALNYDYIEEATNRILKANKIYFVGVGYSGVLAEDAYYRFMDLGIDCSYFRDINALSAVSKFLKSDDVIIVISRNGNTTEINSVIENIREKKVNVIAITENLLSKLARVSDITINYNSHKVEIEDKVVKSKVIEKYVLELLYLNVVRRNSIK